MDFHGNINLQQNLMQRMVVQSEDNFPVTPIVGRVVFKGAKLYMCVAINNTIPVWLPLTNKIDTYVHTEAVAATTWTVTHNLNTTIPLLQVYNAAGEMLIPDSVTPTSNNVMEVTFSAAVDGTAVVLFGDLMPQSGIGLLEPATIAALTFTLDNPNDYGTDANDFFGYAVAVSGNNAIVGAYGEDTSQDTLVGRVYIFDITTGGLLHTIDNPDAFGTDTDDRFGWVVDIDGNNAIVSTWAEDDAGGLQSGKAYIYNVSTGGLLQTLDNPNAYGASSNDIFGYSAAISGNFCIVGAHQEDEAVGNTIGKAYIFNVTTGALLHTLDNPNAFGIAEGDQFGYSVDIDGNNAIVGAIGEADAGGANSGKAYIFNVTTGGLSQTLTNPNAYNTSLSDRFGSAVGISGNNCIVGANKEDDAVGSSSGKAYIFNVTTGALLQT